MSNEAEVPITKQPETPTTRSPKRALFIGAGVAVALVIAGGVGIPAAIHASQVSEYHDTIESTQQAFDQTAADQSKVEASAALTGIAAPAAHTFAEQVATLSQAGEPTFSKEDSQALAEAVKGAKIEKAQAPKESALKAAHDKQVKADAEAAAAAKKSKKEAPEPTVPTHVLDLTSDQAASLLDLLPEKASVKSVSDDTVTGETVEKARSALSEAEKKAKSVADEAKAADAVITEMGEKVGSLGPALASAAGHAPEQGKAAIAQYEKAAQAEKDAVTQAAAAAEQVSKKDSAATTALYAAVQQYADAVAKAKAGHDATVQAEADAAAAAAAQEAAYVEGGYVDPVSGGWVGGGDGGWGGGYSGGGGGYVDPGSGWGGGGGYVPPAGGGGGGYVPPAGGGGGYVPPADSGGGGCLAPPAGWFPTGGTANGCPTYSPPMTDGGDW